MLFAIFAASLSVARRTNTSPTYTARERVEGEGGKPKSHSDAMSKSPQSNSSGGPGTAASDSSRLANGQRTVWNVSNRGSRPDTGPGYGAASFSRDGLSGLLGFVALDHQLVSHPRAALEDGAGGHLCATRATELAQNPERYY
jgi:hypothetical protein